MTEVAVINSNDEDEIDDILTQCTSLVEVAEMQVLPELSSEISVAGKTISRNKKDYKQLKNSILDRKDFLISQINKVADVRLLEASRCKKENKKKFKKHKSKIEKISSRFQKETEEMKVKIQENPSSLATESLPALPESAPMPTMKVLMLEQAIVDNVEEVFGRSVAREDCIGSKRADVAKITHFEGTANVDSPRPSQMHPKSQVVQVGEQLNEMLPRFGGVMFDSSAKSRIHSILAVNGQAFLWCFKDREITLIDRDSTPIETYAINGVKNVVDLTSSPVDGSVWLCSEDQYIYRINERGSCQMRFKVKEEPICLLVRENDVLVGTEKCIHVCTYRGEIIQDLLQDQYKKLKRFGYCQRTGMIAVVCDMKIFVLDGDLAPICTYPDGQDGYIMRKFSSAAFDVHGNMIVADTVNKTLILVNKEGKRLETLVRKDDDDVPCAVSTGDEGFIWAGYQNSVMPETAVIEIFEWQ